MTETGETKITSVAGLEYAQGPGEGNQIGFGKLSPGVIYSGGALGGIEIQISPGKLSSGVIYSGCTGTC